jgi:hypothetical protein
MEKSIFGLQNVELEKFAQSLEKMNTISDLFKQAKTVEDLNAINQKLTTIMKSVQGQNKDPFIYTNPKKS